MELNESLIMNLRQIRRGYYLAKPKVVKEKKVKAKEGKQKQIKQTNLSFDELLKICEDLKGE